MKKLAKMFGYGAIIWGVAFVVASIFVAFKASSQMIMQGITTLAVLIVAFSLARGLNVSSKGEMLKYTAAWVITGLILDYLISTRFAPNLFSSWYIWVGYLLLLIVPLFAVKSEKPAA